MKKETASLLGTTVGHIRVINLVGEGGMGAVYAGFDEKLERQVALKAIHSDFRLNPQSKARFLREARILSQLDHPNICTIHDYVTGDENDFLVMELVEGRSLRIAIKQGLTDETKMEIAKELLEVLVEVHGQGVIHRDLKPENIMITPENRIKVLDFGLSRSVEEDVAFTHAETLNPDDLRNETSNESVYVKTTMGTIIGTASYMSPEQARGEPATAASDMYSVGLIFQEMFAEERPFEEGLGKEELLARAGKGETKQVTGLQPDLAALINRLKSLAPGVRPSSADAADQLQRILDKPKRRRKRVLVAAIWIVLTLLAIGMSIQSVRAAKQAKLAQREAATSEEVTEFLLGLFQVSDPGEARGNTVTAREILDKGAEDVDERLAAQPEVRARMMGTIGRVYTNLGLYGEAERLLKNALAIQRRILGGEHPDTLRSVNELANVYWYQRRFGDAEPLYSELVETRRRVLGNENRNTLTAQYDLASCYLGLERYPEMEELSLKTLDAQTRVLGDDHPDTVATMGNLASLYWLQERYEDSKPIQEKVLMQSQRQLGANHPETLRYMHNLATVYHRLGQYDDAEPLYVEAIEIQRRVLGDPHPETAASIRALGRMYKEQGRYQEAETFLNNAHRDFMATLGDQNERSRSAARDLAALYEAWGKPGKAAEYMAMLAESEKPGE